MNNFHGGNVPPSARPNASVTPSPLASDEIDHVEFVEAWLGEKAKGWSSAMLVSLFERATSALWRRAQVTLGEVTLAAIVDRVLYTASEKYSFLATLRVDETGVRFEDFRRQDLALQDDRIASAVLFVLAEFLTVLGHLTDEILTPALHAELAKVELEEPGLGEGTDKIEETRS
jgi:hypothetical protein